MKYVLGIDQGGTKTQAIVMDYDGHVLGLGNSCGSAYIYNGFENSIHEILRASEDAINKSNISMTEISYIGAGITCIDWPSEEKRFRETLEEIFGQNVVVQNDCIIAMRAGTSKRVSAIICAGTETNIAVQNNDDLFIYGYYIPKDRLGGKSISEAILQKVYDQELGLGPKTKLTQEVLSFFGLDNVTDLLYSQVMGEMDHKMFMKLPILAGKVAQEGDKIAERIWIETGYKYSECLIARMKKMGMLEKEVEVILSGSIFKTICPKLIESVKGNILKYAPNSIVKSSEYEPVVGAGLIALDKLYGTEIPKAVYDNIKNSSEQIPIKRII